MFNLVHRSIESIFDDLIDFRNIARNEIYQIFTMHFNEEINLPIQTRVKTMIYFSYKNQF